MTALLGLTREQFASVAFTCTFVTVIGGIILAFYYRAQNLKKSVTIKVKN